MLFHTDIIFYMGSYLLPFSFMVRLRRLNKEMLALLDDDFFIILSIKMYGKEFWDRIEIEYDVIIENTKNLLSSMEDFIKSSDEIEEKLI